MPKVLGEIQELIRIITADLAEEEKDALMSGLEKVYRSTRNLK